MISEEENYALELEYQHKEILDKSVVQWLLMYYIQNKKLNKNQHNFVLKLTNEKYKERKK